jgi:hypothetical protein
LEASIEHGDVEAVGEQSFGAGDASRARTYDVMHGLLSDIVSFL